MLTDLPNDWCILNVTIQKKQHWCEDDRVSGYCSWVSIILCHKGHEGGVGMHQRFDWYDLRIIGLMILFELHIIWLL